MKKILLLTILMAVFAFQANAQKNVVKFNPFPLILGTIELSYERVVTENSSLELDMGYTSITFNDDRYNGFSVGLQYRFYLQKKYSAPKGWFAGPYGSYSSTRFDDGDLQTTVISGGAIIGYQWQLDPIAIDIYFGPGYFDRNADDDAFDIGFDGLGLKAGVAIGVSF